MAANPLTAAATAPMIMGPRSAPGGTSGIDDQGGAEDGRDAQEEREPGRRVATDAAEDAAGDCRPGAGDSRHDGQRLPHPDDHRVDPAEGGDPSAGVLVAPGVDRLGDQQQRRGPQQLQAGQRRADPVHRLRGVVHALQPALDQHARERRGNRAHRQESEHPGVAPVVLIPPAEQRPDRADRDPPQVSGEVHDQRDERADVERHVERQARSGPAEQERNDDEMRGGGDRDELGEPLHHAEHRGLERGEGLGGDEPQGAEHAADTTGDLGRVMDLPPRRARPPTAPRTTARTPVARHPPGRPAPRSSMASRTRPPRGLPG